MLKVLRYLLFPLSLLYAFVTTLRNWLYDTGLFASYKIPLKSICVGNLSVGGTGKTPHVAYIATLFKEKQRVQLLSRGYGRATNGFLDVTVESSAQDVGDEPLLYFSRFKNALDVSVCESRKKGIETILSLRNPSLIILDDAYQHRAVSAGFSILLSDFSSPFYTDFHLPTGNLRETKAGIKRANQLIITKCPENLSEAEKSKIISKIDFPKERIYFSSIVYGNWVPITKQANLENYTNVLLVTGIANPFPLLKHLSSRYKTEIIQFKDHHSFTAKDIIQIQEKFDTFASDKKAIVTTEKDFMRLKTFLENDKMQQIPWFYQSMQVKIDREQEFIHELNTYVDTI